MTTKEKIKALCYSDEIPDHVKRHFAADCAERSMFSWCERTSKEPFPEWWNLMAAIRDYAEGKIPIEALGETREPYFAADWAVDSGAYWAAYWAAYVVAYWAAYSAADYAANSAADSAAEHEWQLQHFHELIEQHDALKSRLLGLFNRCATEITHALPQALKQYEEALFI